LLASLSFFPYYLARPHLLSFPTRRSSDLAQTYAVGYQNLQRRYGPHPIRATGRSYERFSRPPGASGGSRHRRRPGTGRGPSLPRSEEHTSELQSRENLVCRLLLEKKKIRT